LGRSAQSLFQQQQWQQQFLSPLVVVPVKQQQGVSRTYCTSSGDPPPAEPCSPAADAEEAEASAEVRKVHALILAAMLKLQSSACQKLLLEI
jgi:hypothetical protein